MKIKVKDFEKLKTVGLGSYGRVRLCKHKKTGEIYVMKLLKKNEIIKQKQVDHVYSEFNILSSLKHPFIVQLIGYNFEDPTSNKRFFPSTANKILYSSYNYHF